jgi:uncharacterized protein
LKNLKAFQLNFGSLADGNHTFQYHIDSDFFENFENSLLQTADIQVKLSLHKTYNLLTLDFELVGTIQAPCDICTEPVDIRVDTTDTLLVKLISEELESDRPDVIYLIQGSTQVDISQHLYELVSLSLPMRRTHPEDENGVPTCDPAVLKHIQNHPANADQQPSNPIWDALKNLK